MDLNLHRAWIDEEGNTATFPFWNINGQMVGYQRYIPNAPKIRSNDEKGRYYTWRNKDQVSFWGMESWYLSNPLFLCEGIFDACHFTKLGYSALATISNDPSGPTSKWLMFVRKIRPIIAVCDDDPAGRKLAKYGNTFHVVKDGKDIGDSTDEYVHELARKFL